MQGSARVYQTPAAEFELQSFRLLPGERPTVIDRRGPEIVLCQEGHVTIENASERHALAQGQALFIAAQEPSYALSGQGSLFRASVGRS